MHGVKKQEIRQAGRKAPIKTVAMAAFLSFVPLAALHASEVPKGKPKPSVARQDSLYGLGALAVPEMTKKEIVTQSFSLFQYGALKGRLNDAEKDYYISLLDTLLRNPELGKAVIEEFQFYHLDAWKLFRELPADRMHKGVVLKDGVGYNPAYMEPLAEFFGMNWWTYLPPSAERPEILGKLNSFVRDELGSDVQLDESFFFNVGNYLKPSEVLRRTNLDTLQQLKLLEYLQQEGISTLRPGATIFSKEANAREVLSIREAPSSAPATGWQKFQAFVDSKWYLYIPYYFLIVVFGINAVRLLYKLANLPFKGKEHAGSHAKPRDAPKDVDATKDSGGEPLF